MFPIVLGDIDSSGNLNANIIHQFHSNVRTRIVAQVKKNNNIIEFLMSEQDSNKAKTPVRKF